MTDDMFLRPETQRIGGLCDVGMASDVAARTMRSLDRITEQIEEK